MSNWIQAKTSAFIPSSLNSVISTAQTVATTASTILGVVKGAIDFLKTFLIAFPAFDWASALAIAIEQFKNDFLATGFYMLNMWDYPLVQYNRSGGVVIGESFESSFEADVTDAFFDEADPNRPPFSGNVAALILIGAAPSIDAVTNIIQIQKDAFTWWTEIKSVYDRLNKVNFELQVKAVCDAIKNGEIKFSKNPSEQTIQLLSLNLALQQVIQDIEPDAFEQNIKPYAPTINSTPKEILHFVGVVQEQVANPPYPNFEQTSLRTIILPLPQVFNDALDPLLAALATGRSITDTINALLDSLTLKIEALDNIVQSINGILSQLDNLLNDTSLLALYVTSSNGLSGLATEIANAKNKPLVGTTGYYSGIVLIGGGPGLTPFKNLFGPIGSV